MERRWGPIRGAGVAVQEKDTSKPIGAAALGVTAWVGIAEKGPIGKLVYLPGKKEGGLRIGGYIPESTVRDCEVDFHDAGQGRGELYFLRVTDGTEKKAEVTLYNRQDPSKPCLKVQAENGGRWAGRKTKLVGEFASAGDITQTTLDISSHLTAVGRTLKVDELKGSTLYLDGVTAKTYEVIGNTVAGVLTVSPDSTMLTDFGAGTDFGFKALLGNNGKHLAVTVKDGTRDPVNEFSLSFYLNGEFWKTYDNLTLDPVKTNFVENEINLDTSNYQVRVTSLWTGAALPDARPANSFSGKSSVLTDTVLTAPIARAVAQTANAGNGTLGTFTSVDPCAVDHLLVACVDDTTPGAEKWNVTSDLQGSLPQATTGVAYPAANDYTVGFSIAAGATPWAVGDKFDVYASPFEVDAMVGGYLVPNTGSRRTRFEIVDNGHKTVTVKTGSTMLTGATVGDPFRVEFAQQCAGGYDGLVGIGDATYIAAFDTVSSPLKALKGKEKGLVHVATPGVNSVAVQQAGRNFAEAMNWQYRGECPANITTDDAAETFVNDTLGRHDFEVMAYPSYAYRPDPLALPGSNAQKLISLTGLIQGREALWAANNQGYHQPAAGTEVTLPGVIRLPTGDVEPDGEILNPVGLQLILKKHGNWCVWGARTLSLDPNWKFKHAREYFSHLENVLQESLDWIVFRLNKRSERAKVHAACYNYFMPEWRQKEALVGDTFEEACIIKIDEENNSPDVTASGDAYLEISPNLADIIERLNIIVSKQGVQEAG